MYYAPHIPPPDYHGYSQPVSRSTTFEAPENIIPAPDYARYEPQIDYELPVDNRRDQNRLETIREENPIQQDTQVLPQGEELTLRLPNPRNENSHQVVQPSRPVERQEPRPRLPETRNGYAQQFITEDQRNRPSTTGQLLIPVEKTPKRENRERNYFDQESPFPVHSYLEDRQKLEQNSLLPEATRSHIRNIGVPVLPPLGGNRVNEQNGGLSPSQNKAFIRHLENHRKFDTMKSLKGIKACPLCQMMLGSGWQEEIEERTKNRRPDVRDFFNESETEVDWVLTRRGYEANAEGELSVDNRDKVQVMQVMEENAYALCRKTDGTMGYLPLYILPRVY